MPSNDNNNLRSTRREFVQGGLSLAVMPSAEAAWDSAGNPRRDFEFGEPLKEFNYRQVSFQPGIHDAQLLQTHAVIMSLDEDSLLRPFRVRSGMHAPGNELGGWYSSNGFVPAHSFGQWLSALSRYYAITGDERTRSKVHRLVDGLKKTLKPDGTFYKRYPVARGYSFDLLTLGLVEAHKLVGHPDALSTLNKAAQAVAKYLPDCAVPMFGTNICEPDEKVCIDHTYVIPENQFMAWQQSGDQLHLKMAQRYLFDELFDQLAEGRNVLGGLHAYTHVNALSSAAKAYLVLGDEKYLRAARNGFDFLAAQSYATGGWGPDERLLPTSNSQKPGSIMTLNDSLGTVRNSFETPCGAWAHFKLTRYMLRITKDPKYGDSMERVMYNTVLGAKPLCEDGRAFYHSSYHAAAHKTYYEGDARAGVPSAWPCCSGSLPQVAAEYRAYAYFQDESGIYVNLYIPSTLTWRQFGRRVSLTQTGSYPLGDNIHFKVEAAQPTRFSICLRIPAWARDATVRINGSAASLSPLSGTFATVNREWRDGDEIELVLPRTLALIPIDSGHSEAVALTCGPLVLFAISDTTPKVTRSQLLRAVQLELGGAEWRVDAADRSLQLRPYWAIGDEAYYTYFFVR